MPDQDMLPNSAVLKERCLLKLYAINICIIHTGIQRNKDTIVGM